jgi:hypothetical protein
VCALDTKGGCSVKVALAGSSLFGLLRASACILRIAKYKNKSKMWIYMYNYPNFCAQKLLERKKRRMVPAPKCATQRNATRRHGAHSRRGVLRVRPPPPPRIHQNTLFFDLPLNISSNFGFILSLYFRETSAHKIRLPFSDPRVGTRASKASNIQTYEFLLFKSFLNS